LVVAVVAGIGFLSVPIKFDASNRFTLVFDDVEGDILVSSLDPVALEIVNIKIPSDLEVEVSGNLGKRKLGKVWEIGIQEGIGGEILSNTIVFNLGLPIMAWSDGRGFGIIEGGLWNLIKSVFSRYDSSLGVVDKVKIAVFSRKVDTVRRQTIDLRDTGLIKKTVLIDGSEGYVLTGITSAKLFSYFADYTLVEEVSYVNILDGSKDRLGKKVGKIIEILGGKVTKIDYVEDYNFRCKVLAREEKKSKIISAVFGCETSKLDVDSDFDIQILLGNKFTL
jgi:hypothetical protein